jgi:hypothetical protein
MNEFAHSADPPRRPRARAIPPLLSALSALSAGSAAVGYMSVLTQEFPIPLPWRTGLLTQTNSTC